MIHIIAIIEDDNTIRAELSAFLRGNGFDTIEITDYENADIKIISANPQLVLLDINLPYSNGLTICQKIRRHSQIPVIFVTSCNTSMDELNCLMNGGDDYISKPFQPPILLARIKSVLKRTSKQNESESFIYEHNGVILDAGAGTLCYNGKKADLTKNELKICCYLFTRPGIIISRSELIDYLWDNGVYIEDNILSVQITRLRNKLHEIGSENFIETKRGLGYKI